MPAGSPPWPDAEGTPSSEMPRPCRADCTRRLYKSKQRTTAFGRSLNSTCMRVPNSGLCMHSGWGQEGAPELVALPPPQPLFTRLLGGFAADPPARRCLTAELYNGPQPR